MTPNTAPIAGTQLTGHVLGHQHLVLNCLLLLAVEVDHHFLGRPALSRPTHHLIHVTGAV